mgnify:CR=1 FL=1
MFVVFYSTSNVFKAEEILNNNNVECSVVPTPVMDRAYCGVCLEVKNGANLDFISNIEHVAMEG